MQIIEKNINELIPYDKNNKTHSEKQINLVANSISQFGFNTPIIIDASNVIIAGHCRLEASKKLGLEKVPCVIKDDLTEAQLKAYRIVDNKLASLGDWDTLNIQQEMEILSASGFDFPSVGLDDFLIGTATVENNEIDQVGLEESKCELKIKFSPEDYSIVTEKLREINTDFAIAIMSLLDV